MASMESIMIKVEFEEICHGCLSSDRSLLAPSENTDLFLCLLGRDYVEDPTSISLCWECSAMLRNTRRFQRRIQMAQDIMQQSLNQQEHFCLSTLAINKTETHCNPAIQRNLINQDHEIDTRCEDFLKKQPAVKLETVEVKYENKFDSEIYVDDVDMEYRLHQVREKEEYFNNITQNRIQSPSSTRDSSITVDPLAKMPKWNENNEIKTEETTEEANTDYVNKTITEVQGRPNKLFSCNVCGKKYTTEDYLNVHYRTHRAVGVFECDICKKTFLRKRHIKKHLLIHTGEKSYRCEICDKRFSQQENWKMHLRIHTGEKPYVCEVCDKRFTRKAHLENHLRTHSGEKPYSCETCNKRFNEQGHLKRHLRTHTGDKPFSCEICNKKFNRKGYLKLHLRLHKGDKPYSCEICQKGFSQKSYLKVHLRIHTGDKPYSCEVCDKKFNELGHLKRHLSIHSGDNPYRCEICDKRFNQQQSLKRHLRTHK